MLDAEARECAKLRLKSANFLDRRALGLSAIACLDFFGVIKHWRKNTCRFVLALSIHCSPCDTLIFGTGSG